jgi:hypothetical protein
MERRTEEKFMQSDTQAAPVSKKSLWAGRIISALVVVFLLFDAVAKLMKIAPVLQAFVLELPQVRKEIGRK